MHPPPPIDAAITETGRALAQALGARALCVAAYGSAASSDWAPAHSDVNLALVLEKVETADLRLVGEVLSRQARAHPTLRFAAPLVLTPEFLDRARDVFAIELADLRDRHHILAGTDLLTELRFSDDALRAQAEREVRGKLLRLRALAIARPPREETIAALIGAAATFRVLGRHLPALRTEAQDAIDTWARRATSLKTQAAGPATASPSLRRLEEHRAGVRPWPDDAGLDQLLEALLDEVESAVRALDSDGH